MSELQKQSATATTLDMRRRREIAADINVVNNVNVMTDERRRELQEKKRAAIERGLAQQNGVS